MGASPGTMFPEGRRAHCTDGETEESKDEALCPGLKLACEFIRNVHSQPCGQEDVVYVFPWEDWLRR